MGNNNILGSLQNTPYTSRYSSNKHLGYLNNKNSNTISKDCSFEGGVSNTLCLSRTPGRTKIKNKYEHPNSNANHLFWDSMRRTMGLYHYLMYTPLLNSDCVFKLIFFYIMTSEPRQINWLVWIKCMITFPNPFIKKK